MDDYTSRTNPTVPQTSDWGGQWRNVLTNYGSNNWIECGSYIANNYRNVPSNDNTYAGMCTSGFSSGQTPVVTGSPASWRTSDSRASRYDHSVRFETYVAPSGGVTVCSKQTANAGFEALKSNGNYDIMINGDRSKADCIKIMEDEAT